MEELKRQVDQKHQDVRLLKARFLVTVGENSSKHQAAETLQLRLNALADTLSFSDAFSASSTGPRTQQVQQLEMFTSKFQDSFDYSLSRHFARVAKPDGAEMAVQMTRVITAPSLFHTPNAPALPRSPPQPGPLCQTSRVP